MKSFLEFWETINPLQEIATGFSDNDDQDELSLDNNESASIRVIKTGLGFDDNFWDDFKSLLNDAEGLSELLDVPKEKITGWGSKIDELIEKAEGDQDKEETEKKSEMIPTGHQPIAGIEGVDSNADGPAETRPTP